jgi:hypothetical protein
MNAQLDRDIERWLRRLLISDGTSVRRLTEEEVQAGMGRPKRRRKA